jgi:hypothetical protein
MKLIASLLLFLVCTAYQTFAQFEAYPATIQKEGYQPFNGRRTQQSTIQNRDAGDIIVADDFSDPTNWSFMALESEANWTIVTEEPEEISDFMGEMESTTEANGFGIFNGIQYLLDGSVTTQDAVLEYAHTIDCSEFDHVTLSFEQRYRAFWTDQTFVEVSNNGGVSYDYSYEINTDVVANAPSTQEELSFSIAEAAGGQEFVKIRFRWKEETGNPDFGSGYGWMIDDFKVVQSWDFDYEILTSYKRSNVGGFMPHGIEYYQTTIYQVQPLHFSSTLRNLGGMAQNNLKLNMEITGEDSFVTYSDSITLDIDAFDSLVCNNEYLAEEIGLYHLKYWCDSDSSEQITNNDTLQSWFELTNASISRHNGIPQSTFTNIDGNTGSPVQIGYIVEFTEDDLFHAVFARIGNSATNIGKMVRGQIRMYNEETETFDLIATSVDHEISASDLGEEVLLDYCGHDGPGGVVYVPSGSTILVLVGHFGGATEVEFMLAQNVENGTVYGYTWDDETPFYIEDARMPMIRLSMLSGCGSLESNSSQQNISISQNTPNPFKESTTIQYELVISNEVLFTITDLSGKVIKTINLGNQTAGKHHLRLNGNDFSEGVYFYTFNVGNETVTKRMIVIK